MRARLPNMTRNRVGDIKVHHATELDKLIRGAQEMKNQGCIRLFVQKLNLEEIVALAIFDASFAQEAGLKSQCGMFRVLTDRQATNRLVIGNLLEVESSTILRVVRSTMAAESAALSKRRTDLADRDWRSALRVPGILIVDAESLYDHLRKDSSVPVERPTLLAVFAKDLVERKCIEVGWLPNSH